LNTYDPGQYGISIHNNVPFVMVPTSLNENDGPMYANVEICSPYIESNENVKRIIKAPLKKISTFLANDFETSAIGEVFPYTASDSILDTAERFWQRESDFFDNSVEFISGNSAYAYNYDFPKFYPLPDDADVSEHFINNYPNISKTFFA